MSNVLAQLPSSGHMVVVAPHPDDEVFALGGTMALLQERGCTLEVVFVTDGEGSHSRSSRITERELSIIRARETDQAWEQLGITPAVTRLRLPDGAVRESRICITGPLRTVLERADACFVPLETDGHPDHETAGDEALELATAAGVPVYSYAVWAHLNPSRIQAGEPQVVELPDDLLARKRRAVDCYQSQLLPLGPLPEDGPVLPSGFLDHFTTGEEWLWPR